jgi:dihydroorotase
MNERRLYMYDLLIKGGRVIDPAQNVDDRLDIAISGDKIAKIAEDIPLSEGQQAVDAEDKIVAPGLIDLHCHVYDSIFSIGIEPDVAGVKQGVTTVVDGGSAGQATFGGFPKYVIPSSRTTVFCFLHLGSLGLSIMPELKDWAEIDLDATAATVEANQELIKGIKLRLVGNIVASHGVEVVKIVKKLAKNFNLPVMVHIGDVSKQVSPALTQEFLPLMEPGDIVSHVFTPQFGGVLRTDGMVLPQLKDAMGRGVILDVAHGRFNLSFEVAQKSMAQGVFPTTLSTDLSTLSVSGPVYGLTVTMSKFLALGLDLREVIRMTTINPARALGTEDRKGSLKPGMDADVSILQLLSGAWKLEDSEQQTLKVTGLLAPVMAIKSGQPISSQPAAQPRPID